MPPHLHQQVLVLGRLGLTPLSRHQRGSLVAVGAFALLYVPELLVQVGEHLVLCALLAALPHDVLEHQAVASDPGLGLECLRGDVLAAADCEQAELLAGDGVAASVSGGPLRILQLSAWVSLFDGGLESRPALEAVGCTDARFLELLGPLEAKRLVCRVVHDVDVALRVDRAHRVVFALVEVRDCVPDGRDCGAGRGLARLLQLRRVRHLRGRLHH